MFLHFESIYEKKALKKRFDIFYYKKGTKKKVRHFLSILCICHHVVSFGQKSRKVANHLNVGFVTILHPEKIIGINICYQQVSKKCVTKV